ncbi:MAG: TonB family protein [Candidatus Latescibacteria bacterium]|nr:TonB family protein [bacterium]MBD3423587.1 TonB family protein [Candidatus Latescibacterota bacterium]
MRKIPNQPHRSSRYLLIYLPAALAVLIVLLVLLERSRIIDRKFIGYQGKKTITPRVEIVTPRAGPQDRFFRRNNPIRVVEPESEKQEKPEGEIPIESEEKTVIPDEIELDPELYYRSYPSHTRVPYSDDYVILNMVKPEYPEDALEKGIEGYVIIEVLIDEDGRVKEAWTRKVYGSESFREVSMDAIEKFLFRPKLKDGKPEPFWISFIFKFTFFGGGRTYR